MPGRKGPAPDWEQIIAMMNAPREPPLPKWVVMLVAPLAVVMLGGLGTYAGSTIAGVGQIGPKIDGLKGSLDDLKTKVETLTQQTNGQQLAIGKQDLRIQNLETTQGRLLDRMRQVEGGQRINAPAPGLAVP